MRRLHSCRAIVVVLCLAGCALQEGVEASSAGEAPGFDPGYCNALVSSPAQIAVDRFLDQYEESADYGYQDFFTDLQNLNLVRDGYAPDRIEVVRWDSRPYEEITVSVRGREQSIRFNVQYATEPSGLGYGRADVPRSVDAEVDRGAGFMDCSLAAQGIEGLEAATRGSARVTRRVESFCQALSQLSRETHQRAVDCDWSPGGARDFSCGRANECGKTSGESDGLESAAELCQRFRMNLERTGP